MHKFKETVPKKKGQALTPSLQSKTRKQKPVPYGETSAKQSTAPEAAGPSGLLPGAGVDSASAAKDNAWACGTCGEECLDEPKIQSQFSISCDVCGKWHHYGCMGDESFIHKKRLKWHCKACLQRKSKRKYQGKKNMIGPSKAANFLTTKGTGPSGQLKARESTLRVKKTLKCSKYKLSRSCCLTAVPEIILRVWEATPSCSCGGYLP